MIKNIAKRLFNSNMDSIKYDLLLYYNDELIRDIYFIPKKIEEGLVSNKINDDSYLNKVVKTINSYKNIDIEKVIEDKIKSFEEDVGYRINDYKLYVIIGLDTTTIYSTKYNGEDITVLLLEATDGNMGSLDMLLAHEFTHFVRKQYFDRDIFENCIGERFIVEGIGCNYSQEVAPNREDYTYCIVDKDIFLWVKNNRDKVEEHMKGHLDSREMMYDYFYMFADTEKTGLPPRTGYVYGYLIVKEYLEKKNLKIKDIINMDWEDILL